MPTLLSGNALPAKASLAVPAFADDAHRDIRDGRFQGTAASRFHRSHPLAMAEDRP